MTTGQDFVKNIRPIGAAMFLMMLVLFLIICFTARPDPLLGYEAPHDSTYYAQNDATLGELKTELETNVFAKLSGEESCTVKDGKLEIVIDSASFKSYRSALLKHFDGSLFELVSNQN
ncbi:MAG: hypothetical protein CVU91_00425 [Firmicutes bacterium HGW-Firmicutes-16]|nr:MAG: hypothetical protein CVU91_00425 [Firmicutes bacterium HGW-Firmicutes-16]